MNDSFVAQNFCGFAEIVAQDKTLRIYDQNDAGGRIHCSHDYWAHNVPYMLDWLEERL